MGGEGCKQVLMMVLLGNMVMKVMASHNYADALSKSILFFEGQRSGKLPSSQRLTWRKDSALSDGSDIGIDVVGGYYDAGDNVKFNFPMAFSTTLLAWSVIEFGHLMGPELQHTLDAIRWGTDYFLKATNVGGTVVAQVGDPYDDHNCWQRPEDMNTARTSYVVNTTHPGSEVSAEIAAALAASSIAFRNSNATYSNILLQRAFTVFDFADTYQGSYSQSLGQWVCPFYCDWSGYKDELVWGAAWLFKATKSQKYWDYLVNNVKILPANVVRKTSDGNEYSNAAFSEFGWDDKHAGINILMSQVVMKNKTYSKLFVPYADKFVCSILPESPTKSVKYSPGGLLFKQGGSNMQHSTALSFLLLVYAEHLASARRRVHCNNVVVRPSRMVHFVRSQVDYILGNNPLKFSYMVGYGAKFPGKIHHRGSSVPSVDQHPQHIECKGGTPYYQSETDNPNLLIGAVTGGPEIDDSYLDSRANFSQSEPTTYINAPLVGILAYMKRK